MTSPGRDIQGAEDLGTATVTGMLAATDFKTGDVIAGRFRIVRLLGMGGMGVVYQANDLQLGVDVALKLLRPELASRPDAFERFRQELLLARQVSSPHVVRIHDLVQHAGAWLISMDYVAGASLERMLDTQGPLPPAEAIRITRELALGLAAAHQRQVVHRDLKPANVMIGEKGEALITDFGVARSAGVTGITGSGVVIGTPEYLSPEQARAEPVDGRSDLYALGLILFELLSGKLPFRDGTPAEMLAQRIVRNPPSIDTLRPELPKWIVALCAHLLELKPARRFQSAAEVVAAIDAQRVPRSPFERRRRQQIGAATLLALFAAGVSWQWRDRLFAHDGAATPVVAAQMARLDLLPLPLLVDDKNDAAQALGHGIAQILADDLSGASGFASADLPRVERALTELGYDAADARRHRARIAEMLPSRLLLEGELKQVDGGDALSLRLLDASTEKVLWTASSPPMSGADWPRQVSQLYDELRKQLKLPPSALQWPQREALQLAGRSGSGIEIALPGGTEKNPQIWWMALSALDRAGRTADAAAAAGQAYKLVEGDPAPAAQRTRAFADLLLGRPESARDALLAIVAQSPHDHPARALLARAQAESDDLAGAEKTLNALVAEDPRNGAAWFALGKYAIMQGNAQQAVDEYLTRAQVVANRQQDLRLKGEVSNALGVGFKDLGQNEPAAEQFQHAAQLRSTMGDARGEAMSLRNLAVLRAVLGNFAEADQALARARKLIEPLGDSVALAALANDSGAVYEERGDYRAALEAYREALSLRRTQGDARLIGESLNNVGFAYYQIGDFDNAEVYWQQAGEQFARLDDLKGRVSAQQNLGLAQIARGDFVAARASLEASLHSAEEQQMAEERAVSLNNLADLDRLEGRIDQALAHNAEALELFKRREDARGSSEIQLQRAAILLDIGATDGAEMALAGLSAESIGNREQVALLGLRRAEIALNRNQLELARSLAEQSIADALAAHSLGVELLARLQRARTLSASAAANEARAELERARKGLGGYASVPARLLLFEAAFAADPAHAGGDYREARAQLARLPSYGRAFRLHAAAAAALSGSAPNDAALARGLARQALIELSTRVSGEWRSSVLAAAAGLGIDTGQETTRNTK